MKKIIFWLVASLLLLSFGAVCFFASVFITGYFNMKAFDGGSVTQETWFVFAAILLAVVGLGGFSYEAGGYKEKFKNTKFYKTYL